MANRNYSTGTRAALAALSHGTCYWPGCVTTIVVEVDGQFRVNLDIAHIRGLHADGPRYEPSMTDEQRNDFANLIYLCKPHHEEIDRRARDYPVEVLEGWKRDREQDGLDALKGLRSLATPDGLQHAIAEAVKERDEAIEHALHKLDENDTETASLIRELRDEVTAARSYGSVVGEDVAAMLSMAALRLGDLEGNAHMLSQAANVYGSIEGPAAQLADAANKLGDLESLAARLDNAVRHVGALHEAAHVIDSAAQRAMRAADSM